MARVGQRRAVALGYFKRGEKRGQAAQVSEETICWIKVFWEDKKVRQVHLMKCGQFAPLN